ncbi:nucleoside hydrolase [Bacteroidota bacterium]
MKSIIILFSLFLSIQLYAQKQKIIFDCDLGGDIDDAFAFALLLCSQDEFEIMGFCMDHGNTIGRGKIACKILNETGFYNIPVYIGNQTPNIVGKDTALGGVGSQEIWAKNYDKLQAQEKPAADFIIESLNKYPDEIILFTVGPVGNIADIIDKDPEVLKKTKKIVSMFGSIEIGYGGGEAVPEYNVYANIEASKKFMSCGADILLAPLDITDHVILEDDYLTAIASRQTPLTDALGALYALWYRHADWAVTAKMFDGVAVGMVLWPELFTTKKAYVYVDDDGKTIIDKNKEPNCTIGITIKKDEFLNKMSRRILSQNFPN